MSENKSGLWLVLFFVTVFAGFSVRYLGLDFGSPAASARPDEDLVIKEAIYLISGDKIRFHRYPPGLMYLVAGTFKVGELTGQLPEDHQLAYVRDPMPYHMAARWLTLLMASLTILLVGWTARCLFDWQTATMAAFALTVYPLHNLHSHFATVDVPGTLFVALSIHLTLTAQGTRHRLILAALAAGVAAAIKYPMGLVAILPLIAVMKQQSRFKGAATICVATLAGVLLAAPTLLFDTAGVWQGIQAEAFSQSGRRDLVTFTTIASHHWRLSLLDGFTLAGFLIAVAGLAVSYNRKHPLGQVLPFALGLVIFNLFLGVPFCRYFVPMAPVFALAAGALLSHFPKEARTIAGVVLLLAHAPAAIDSFDMSRTLAQRDTRGELLSAFEDGRLPQDLPIVTPDFPFRTFPAGRSALLKNALVELPAAKNKREELRLEMARRLAAEPEKMTVIVFDEVSKNKIDLQDLLKAGDFLYVAPETPAFSSGWITFPFQQAVLLPRLREAENAERIVMTELIDLDPRQDGAFPEATLFGGFDYWFIPMGDPTLVKRSGPRIRVFRISAAK